MKESGIKKVANDLVFSGVQPTGNLHLGNYLGAIKNWVDFQNSKKCIFCIVDLHAITISENRNKLDKYSREVAAAYVASGIEPGKSTIFVQSNVKGHSELAWILGCHTPIGWLNRMTQFKDKAGKNKEKAPLGLYSYPVLMAADILLYKSNFVPVGDDQKQHLELCRDIAQSFNRFYDTEFFPIPEPIITGSATRVMSLKDGKKKMSKSDPSDQSRINLTDSEDQIIKKIQRARTDSLPFPENSKSLEKRPEVENLINIFAAISEKPCEHIIKKYSGNDFKNFKQDLSDVLIFKISKISKEMKKLLLDQSYLNSILTEGAKEAREISEKNMTEIKKIIKFYS
ncbi:MAG: tryptophan--tRNA ligase [Pseudomonadota bacterium]|nr:tryptophan--tRNA ligase [Pseudomonadota bacterium]